MFHSSQVQFTRDGRTLVVAEPDAVTLVELRGDGRRRIAIPGVQAVAAFADQIWVATRAGALIRLARDGHRLDEHALPADPEGVLIPTTIDGPSALWAARESVLLVDDLGSLAIIPSHIDAGIPIARRRFAHYAGPCVTLPTGRSTTLRSGHRITGGCVLGEGTSIAVIAEHDRGRELAVLALPSGCQLQTVSLPPGTVRIAARRGLAVVHAAARRLAVIDLRAACSLGEVVVDGDVADVAVDPDGDRLAIRLVSGELQLASIGERMGVATRLSTSPRGAVRPLEPRPPMIVGGPEPRPCRTRLPRAAALVTLDREIQSITQWALRAILNPRETSRLGHLGHDKGGHHPYEHEVAALAEKHAGVALAAAPQHRSASTSSAELVGEVGAVADRDRCVAGDRGGVAARLHRAAVRHSRQHPRPSIAGRAACPA
ncbi:MAG TPA: hypothetical protein VNO30_44320 [Kofleriaceae bacterium]|nr:hypothetical protein [Kofleriaceae bacterium]